MTKRDLLLRLRQLLNEKGMSKIETLGGSIGEKDNKAMFSYAIECLEATDKEMHDYLTVIKLKYPNIYKETVKKENWLIHSFCRFYVFTTAKSTLA